MNRVRTRLVAACLLTALLPVIPLSFLVRDLLSRSFAASFGLQTQEALEAALEESRERLVREKETFAADIRAEMLSRPGGPASIGLGEPEREGDDLVLRVTSGAGAVENFRRPLPPGVRARAERVTEALGMMRAMESERGAVLRSYIAPFVMVFAVLLALAALVGALLARHIARPIESLARAAQSVGRGDLSTRVREPASGEVGELVQSFNGMVERLAHDRAELARLERLAAWRDLARKLAHEIKNPLTPIQLAVHQASDGVSPADESQKKLLADCREIVDEEIERLRKLVREFSEFGRLPEPSLERGDLAELCTGLVRLYGDDKLHVNLSGPSLEADFDEAELRRALVNLVDNGLAACRDGGRPEVVHIEARLGDRTDSRRDGRVEEVRTGARLGDSRNADLQSRVSAAPHVEILVRDEGSGVAPELLERIFEPSFSTKKEGMGLGLAIVDGIIRGHGGAITVESFPGRGTTFRLTWPAQARPGRET